MQAVQTELQGQAHFGGFGYLLNRRWTPVVIMVVQKAITQQGRSKPIKVKGTYN